MPRIALPLTKTTQLLDSSSLTTIYIIFCN